MLFNIDEKQLMLELKNKDERALKICMNKYYRYVVYIVENIIGSALPYEDNRCNSRRNRIKRIYSKIQTVTRT